MYLPGQVNSPSQKRSPAELPSIYVCMYIYTLSTGASSCFGNHQEYLGSLGPAIQRSAPSGILQTSQLQIVPFCLHQLAEPCTKIESIPTLVSGDEKTDLVSTSALHVSFSYHGNPRAPPQCWTPAENKALLGDCQGRRMALGGNGTLRFPLWKDITPLTKTYSTFHSIWRT